MSRTSSGQQRPVPGAEPAAVERSPLTRRRLITAAALMAGVGVTDAACGAARKGRTALPTTGVTPTPHARTQAALSRANNPALARAGQPSTGHPPAAPHHPEGPHALAGPHHRHRLAHVSLPPAQVPVRQRPAYHVSDLMPHAPKHAIGLTIDDGPDPEWTPKVLRLLDKYHLQANFCVVGVHAKAYPRLIRDIHRAGHTIVNHSFTHVQPFPSQSEKRIVEEITRTQHAIEKAAKVTPQLFRSPGGDWSHFVFRACAAYGLYPLDWDIDPEDWRRPGVKHIKRAMERAKPNDIVLCHDGGGNRAETLRALRRVLPHYKHRGYRSVALVAPPQRQHTTATPTTPPTSNSPSPSPTLQPTATPSD